MNRWPRGTSARSVPATAVLLLAAACAHTAGGHEPIARGGEPTIRSYVALGDSFTSGPGIDKQLPQAGRCRRSDHNYPSLLARRLEVARFRDVSCGGATTAGIVRRSFTTDRRAVAAQLDAVTASTDLVTVGIGANNNRFVSRMYTSCLFEATSVSTSCASFSGGTAPALLRALPAAVTTVLDAIHRKAPRAQVVLVGYLRVLPDVGSCSFIPIAGADLQGAAAVEAALDRTLLNTARSAHVTYVAMRSVSRGHDACSAAPWVNGFAATPGDGIFLHPRAAGMRAVATRLARVVQTF